MAPRRKPNTSESDPGSKKRRISSTEREKLICKKKLDALEIEESQSKEDRFSPEERRILLNAYNVNGFKVFQDTKLLHQYLPNRKESDLKGLVQRLRLGLQTTNQSATNDGSKQEANYLDDWQRLCQQLVGNYAKDRKINICDVFADALMAEADERVASNSQQNSDTIVEESETACQKPDYPKLIRNFAELLKGTFPDNITPANAQVSMKLFDHINNVIESIDLQNELSTLADGTWLNSSIEEGKLSHNAALVGLETLDGTTKKCPTFKDLERSRNIEALCLELPKIKRITDVLNPLHIDESLVSTLMN